MKQFLIDSDVCIEFLRGRFDLNSKMQEVGFANCFLSEITVIELKFGALNSPNPAKNLPPTFEFCQKMAVLPITKTIDFFVHEKLRLWRLGQKIDEFDLFIGSTAVVHNLVMVTHNAAHFARIQGIQIEDWTLATS